MCLSASTLVSAKDVTVASPDGSLTVTVGVDGGKAWYQVNRGAESIINRSALGFVLKDGDLKDNFKMGKVTTGSSLDMQPCDLKIIEENHGELKDMEGAAVAFVCSLFKTPTMLIKSVTDLCDESAETYEIFKKNLAMASHAIADANEKVVNYLLKKS